MLLQVAESTNALGTDLLRNSVFRASAEDRQITGAYLSNASATNGPQKVSLFVSDILAANLQATTTAAQGLQLFPVDTFVPGGSEIRAIIESTGSTAAVAVMTIQLDELDDDMDEGF